MMTDSEKMFNKLNRGQQFKARKSAKERSKDSTSGGFAMVSRRLYRNGHVNKMRAEFSLYTYLLMNTNDENPVCWMAKEQIAEETCIPLRTVENQLKKLRDLGYIDWVQYSEGGRDHNVYFIIPLDEVEGKSVGAEEAATITSTVNVVEEPVRVERKAQEKVTAEELEQAEVEFSFMDTDRRQLMIQAIKQVGYKPGYSNTIADIWDKGNFDYNIANYKTYWITGVWN